MISKRKLFSGAVATGMAAAFSPLARAAEPVLAGIVSPDLRSIGTAERNNRLSKLQGLMAAQGVRGLIVESGSDLTYFTGVKWWRSERVTAAFVPVEGPVVLVTPYFEVPSVRESLQVDADIRPWNEDENPLALLAGAVRETRGKASKVAIEPTTRFFISDGVKALSPGFAFVSGRGLIEACRQIKSAAELALMQAANTVTLEALRQVHGQIQPGMTQSDIAALMSKATRARGATPEFALVLLNEASAYPHGSDQPQSVREGSVILMDCGCSLYDYESDITRTWVYGEPTQRQRQVWNTVRKGQDIALETARPGVPVGKVDDAVRAYYDAEGWGPRYKLPGLSHRTGHGIGMDGHESPYLVSNDATPLKPGMCFSDEPGLYIPGEFGIRL